MLSSKPKWVVDVAIRVIILIAVVVVEVIANVTAEQKASAIVNKIPKKKKQQSN
jgi:hypothetical protein